MRQKIEKIACILFFLVLVREIVAQICWFADNCRSKIIFMDFIWPSRMRFTPNLAALPL